MVKLLQSAGLAVKALTKQTSHSIEQDATQSSTIDQQKKLFGNATAQYFSLLSSVDVRLRRQIYALKDAEILPAEAASRESRAQLANHPQNATMASVPNAKQTGGLGNLDVGWLNSRNDNVGKEMEAELWEQVSRLVENYEEPKATGAQDVEVQRDRDGNDTEENQRRDENSIGGVV